MRLSSLLLLLNGLWCFPQIINASPAVKVALQASFDAPPLLVELLETAAEENATAYFPLVDRIADGHFDHAATDRELYTSFRRLLQDDGHLADPDALASFDLALSLHSAAPRIQAHFHYYNTSVAPTLTEAEKEECESWLDFRGTHHCSPDLGGDGNTARDARRTTRSQPLPFDRVLGGSTNELPSILYADITSPTFRDFHRTVSRTARAGKTSYRIRYRPSPTARTSPLVLNGYGVELALKRTDYIVIDDRQAQQDGRDGDASSSASEGGLASEDVADVRPLSESQLLRLGLRASSFVMDSGKPFDTLLEMVQDFPKHAYSVSKHNVSDGFVAEHQANREVFLPAGYNVLWINGLQVDARKMDAFSLLQQLRRERALINDLRSLGLTGKDAVDVLSHQAIAEAQADDDVQRYDWRDETEGGRVIIWLNDIARDKRYEDWPTSINALLQRTFPGQLPPVRREIHNLIVPADFSDPKHVEIVVETLQSLIKRKVPVRFGLVPITQTPSAAKQAHVVSHLIDYYGLS
ncbi:hypothetical protein LTS18_011844, partial [Coniosporium uncinatum]